VVGEREIIGIYLEESGLDVCCLKGFLGKWTFHRCLRTPIESGLSLGDQVKSILQTVRPSRRRRICLALPRRAVFLREMSFPQLEPEEAARAVCLGIGLHSHMEPAQIYHDEWAFRRHGETVVLLAYASRNLLDPVLRAIQETGHRRSLGPVAPAMLGLDCLLRRASEISFPCSALGRQGNRWIVSLHGAEGWEGSHLLPAPADADLAGTLEGLARNLPHPFSSLARNPEFLVGDSDETEPAVPARDPCRADKDLSRLCGEDGRVTWGLCAAILGTVPYPAFSLQEGTRRRPLRFRIRPYQLLAGATAAGILLATGAMGVKMHGRRAVLRDLEQQATQIQDRLTPFLETQKRLEQTEKELRNIEDFRAQSPPELAILQALAETSPMETWIKSLNLRKDKLRITAEGGSAVEAMAKWRESPLFSDVKLVSPVTKDRQQRERFSVEMTLAGVEGGD